MNLFSRAVILIYLSSARFQRRGILKTSTGPAASRCATVISSSDGARQNPIDFSLCIKSIIIIQNKH